MKLSRVLKLVEGLRKAAAEFPVDSPRVRDLRDEIISEYLHDCSLGKCTPGKAAALSDVFKIVP